MAIISRIELQPRAPAKPALGAPCNGCGACCALEPCPIGRLFFLRLRGPCPALLWQDEKAAYGCGMVLAPGRFLPWLPHSLYSWASRSFARQIAAGRGCDADIEIDP